MHSDHHMPSIRCLGWEKSQVVHFYFSKLSSVSHCREMNHSSIEISRTPAGSSERHRNRLIRHIICP